MSSAILYLAIIAIWACVLIPRLLKRGAVAPVAAPAVADSAAPDVDEGPADGAEDRTAAAAGPLSAAGPAAAGPRSAEPRSAEESRRHMLTARRRLLMMLGGLEIAAIALALTGLAAFWVVIPPTVMLAGYLLLLREAAKSDAELARHEAEAAAAAHARERAAARARAAHRATPADGTSTADVAAAAQALAARLAAAPVPGDYEDVGRDFAPGLAGKYTTSNADAIIAHDDYDDEGYYESYETPRLRAVGD